MNKEHIPVIPLRGLAVLPDAIIHFDLKREKSIHAVEYAMMGDGLVFLASQKDPECQDPGIGDLYQAGTVASVRQVTKLPNQMLRILVGGVKRAMLTAIQETNEAFLEGSIIPQEELSNEELSSVEEEAMLRQLKETIAEFAALHPKLDKNAVQRYQAMEDLGSLLDQITMNLPVEFEKKQQVLEAFDLKERFEAVGTILVNEIQIAGIRNRLAQKLKGKVEKNQKEYLLREQLRYIREELGEENSFSDSEQFEEKLKELQAGVKNPLMLLDEIDKVSNDYKGDTFSALLEVLDGEQNVRFRDHYVEIPLDLSEVLFIATANSTQNIPRPLLDRMELIEVNSYTENEKFHIAKEHLLHKQMEKNGITGRWLSVSDSALKAIISSYTREAGVRELERKIGDICRKAAKEILECREEGREETKVKVTASNIEKYLGKRKYTTDLANKKPEVGIVRGLAWTSVGGDTLQIEVNVMPGKGDIDLTGQMGDVMKESAIIGMSYVRSIGKEHKIDPSMFKENDFHIHIPEGAVPKDGPSAGITMATAIFSAVTGKPVRCDLAMTGEITLRGNVLPIGGLKEKILAARMAGIKEVLVPSENKKDVEEIPEEIRDGITITYVKTMKDVIKKALVTE